MFLFENTASDISVECKLLKTPSRDLQLKNKSYRMHYSKKDCIGLVHKTPGIVLNTYAKPKTKFNISASKQKNDKSLFLTHEVLV